MAGNLGDEGELVRHSWFFGLIPKNELVGSQENEAEGHAD